MNTLLFILSVRRRRTAMIAHYPLELNYDIRIHINWLKVGHFVPKKKDNIVILSRLESSN